MRALLVASEDDPVIPIETIRPYLPRANGGVNGGGSGGHPGPSRAFDEHVRLVRGDRSQSLIDGLPSGGEHRAGVVLPRRA